MQALLSELRMPASDRQPDAIEAREDLSGFSALNDLLNLTRSNAAKRERELLEEIEQLRAQLSQAKDQRDRAEAQRDTFFQQLREVRWKLQQAARVHNQ